MKRRLNKSNVRNGAAIVFLLPPLLVAAGCGGGGEKGNSAAPSPTVVARAFINFPARSADSYNVSLKWNAPANIPSDEILEYQIVRDAEIVGVVSSATETHGIDSAGNRYNMTYRLPNADGTALTTIIKDPAPLKYGVPYRYQVNLLRAQQVGPETKYTLLSLGTSGQVTPLFLASRPLIAENNHNKVTVQIAPIAGANQCILEFSKTEDFSQKAVRGPFSLSAEGSGAFKMDLSREYGAESSNTPGYFRVGLRNSKDFPGPTTEFKALYYGDNYNIENYSGNYIFSQAEEFTINAILPPSPS